MDKRHYGSEIINAGKMKASEERLWRRGLSAAHAHKVLSRLEPSGLDSEPEVGAKCGNGI